MSDDEREEKELDLTSPEVVTKYKSAAEIANSYFLSSYIYIFVFSDMHIYVAIFFFGGVSLVWVYLLAVCLMGKWRKEGRKKF